MSKYAEKYHPRTHKPKRRRPRHHGCLFVLLFRLVITLAVIAVIGAAGLYLVPVSVWNASDNAEALGAATDMPAVPMQVLLLGTDVLNDSSQRSDSIIVASIGNNSIKLTSILRDTVVKIPGHKSGKINAAFAYGGAELAMRTINLNFDMNITHYIVADFAAFVKLVDAVGGVDIDISEAEMEQININVYDSRKVFKPLGYTCDKLTVYGDDVHLNGLQALGYSRIRKIDSDYTRAQRQRTVLQAVLQQLTENFYNPIVLAHFGAAVLNNLETNLTIPEMISLGEKVLIARNNCRTLRLPVDDGSYDNGSSIEITDRQKNIEAFRAFLKS